MLAAYAENINFDGGKDRKETDMKKRYDSLLHGVCYANYEAKSRRLLADFVVLLIAAIFALAGCGNGGGSDDPELAEWNGTWNSYYDYFDEPELVAILEAQYDSSCWIQPASATPPDLTKASAGVL